MMWVYMGLQDQVLFVKFVTSLGHPPDWSAAVRVHPMWLSLASKTEEQLEAYYCEVWLMLLL